MVKDTAMNHISMLNITHSLYSLRKETVIRSDDPGTICRGIFVTRHSQTSLIGTISFGIVAAVFKDVLAVAACAVDIPTRCRRLFDRHTFRGMRLHASEFVRALIIMFTWK